MSAPRENHAPIAGIDVTLDELLRLRFHPAKHKSQRRAVKAKRIGHTRSRTLNRGLDFAKLREYQRGDDVRLIDWKVKAKTNKLYTKVFEEEHERPVLIVLDYRRSMFFGTRVALKSVIATHLAAQLGWMAFKASDQVGGMIFSETAYRDIKPRGKKQSYLQLLNAMVTSHASYLDIHHQRTGDQAAQACDAMLDRLKKHASPGGQIFILSDFADLPESWDTRMRQLLHHSQISAVRLVDTWEQKLPKQGNYTVTDGHSRSTLSVAAPAIRRLHQEHFAELDWQLTETFSHRGQYTKLCTTQPTEPVARTLWNSTSRYGLHG